ncbi:hypothetical protein BDR03DRAFT_1014890 [Suillus americanus]|nr:hypothetical protein BDR03DRAFT_1014890 [Suillus americanus]
MAISRVRRLLITTGIFANHHYSHHERVLDFNRTVQILVEQQKYLWLDDFSHFEGLKSSHLSAFGMVAYAQASQTPGPSREKSGKDFGGGKRQAKGRGEPCHKWNQGECKRRPKSAFTSMFATEEAAGGPTDGENAHWQKGVNDSIAAGQRFWCHFIWSSKSSVLSPTAVWTKSAAPLPRPPPSKFLNVEAINTITSHPDLFKVSTPVNVDVFQSMLEAAHHPNPSFHLPVCIGLHEGFWPWANTYYGDYSTTWEEPTPLPTAEIEQVFLYDQIAKEVCIGHYSSDFGPTFLSGMYSMPIHAVPKDGGKFRLITNHSAGNFLLNSMITKEDIAGVMLDNLQHLGNSLHQFRALEGDG